MSTLHLEPVVESTPVARHWVAAHLRDLPAEVTGCAALLTSELVTNAVLHAATPMCITLHILPDRIRVDVADGNPSFPSIKEYGQDAATGRGLTLFNSLASNWGVQAVDGGKIVWFELPVDFPVAPASVSDGSFRFDLAGITRPESPQRHERLTRSFRQAPRDSGGAPAEVQRGVRGPLPRTPADEGTGGQLTRRAAPARASRRAGLPDRDPLQRPRSGHGRDVAAGGRQQGRVLRLDTRPAAIARSWLSSSTTPCSTKPTSSGWRNGC